LNSGPHASRQVFYHLNHNTNPNFYILFKFEIIYTTSPFIKRRERECILTQWDNSPSPLSLYHIFSFASIMWRFSLIVYNPCFVPPNKILFLQSRNFY
jgi:hypothetical protein